ncbi:MAG TPA: sugar transferase [Limnobacter sp.]|uniref:sugar transferase n=1 Tax=Limnobacter sp. TaxID=2003368 RepID=UPI002ED903F3
MKINDVNLQPASAVVVVPYLQSSIKRIFDLVFASTVLLLTSPLWLVVVALVALDGGPVLYAQRRVGKNGKIFRCWKFRTMEVNAEQTLKALIASNPAVAAEWHSTQKLKNDPRVTAVGRWLRKTSVDELPQFINVLNGTMSVVGPRPFAHDQIALYGSTALAKYLATKPGLTGVWQVHARHDTTFACRARYDEQYFQQASLATDLALVVKTPLAMLRGT